LRDKLLQQRAGKTRVEAIVSRRTIALDLAPIDVDQGDLLVVQELLSLGGRFACHPVHQQAVVEAGVVIVRHFQVEDRRLADAEDALPGGTWA
jgi:hypothetical protein